MHGEHDEHSGDARDDFAAEDAQAIAATRRYLRSHTTADLRFDDHLRPVQFVTAPDGRLVAPVMEAMLGTMDTELFVPDAADDSMVLSITLERLDENGPDGAFCDRWRIHHGEPRDVRWAAIVIDAVRYADLFVDGEALARANPLAGGEAAICRTANAEPEKLRAACLAITGVDVPEPRLVAVDPDGIDVRARFGILRLPLAAEASAGIATAEDMARRVEGLLADGPGDAWETGPAVQEHAARSIALAERAAGGGESADEGGAGLGLELEFGQEEEDPFDDGLF